MLRILAVDDHPIFRKGLVALIKGEYVDSDIMEAENGEEAIDLIRSTAFDIIILDIDMPEKSGIDVLDFLKQNQIDTRALILTMHNDELFFNEAFNRGAKGFLLKEDSSIEIIECIKRVMADQPFVSKKLNSFLENRSKFNEEINRIKEALSSLTKSEMNTLKLVTQNKTSKEIAELLFVTEKSVENYRSRICKKLDLSGGSNTLYKWCIQNKELIL
ncbi:response regulator transcription factor [Paracrocinitomix mangrovi]|uniref:response regulator transcription factor n=1 Tax=Paracrocinitomix mangrovi TaxID=2862509 RepID=UPI001C8F01BE|nr:response regulator transcription factor [Paracrocinitomix mangrovi]UKN01474.1 response regulator transcription factor [Paracrocinitomix mangrovi]